MLAWSQGEGVGGGSVDGGVGEAQGECGAVVPGGPLIHEPRTHGVGGFAEDEVEGALVEVGEVGGEASEGPKLWPTCLTVTSSPLWGWMPGLVGTPMRRWRRGGLAVDGVFDDEGAELAVVPLGVRSAGALSGGGGSERRRW